MRLLGSGDQVQHFTWRRSGERINSWASCRGNDCLDAGRDLFWLAVLIWRKIHGAKPFRVGDPRFRTMCSFARQTSKAEAVLGYHAPEIA